MSLDLTKKNSNFMNVSKPVFVAWQQLPSIQSTVAMATMDFDWLVVDLEHTATTIAETEAIFIACERHNVKPFARLPSADPYLARRLLDVGAQGILIPVVESRQDFDAFAAHCFYPPKGRRGLGLVRANDWGKHLDHYYNIFQPILIAQIETKKGADAIQDILQSPFLDGIMIGPYDLSANLGKPGDFEDHSFKNLCTLIINAAKTNKKMLGIHQVQPIEEELQKKIQEGYSFIAYGTDTVAMKHALKRNVSQ